jgi:hypothetical protein
MCKKGVLGRTNGLLSFNTIRIEQLICLPSRFLATEGGKHFTEHLPSYDARDTHTNWYGGFMKYGTQMGVRCLDIHTRFLKDKFTHWKVNEGGGIHRHTRTQIAWRSHRPTFIFSDQFYRSRKPRLWPYGDPPHWPCDTPLFAKVGTNFVDKRRSLGRYSSLED